jgi:hypothetical protein
MCCVVLGRTVFKVHVIEFHHFFAERSLAHFTKENILVVQNKPRVDVVVHALSLVIIPIISRFCVFFSVLFEIPP